MKALYVYSVMQSYWSIFNLKILEIIHSLLPSTHFKKPNLGQLVPFKIRINGCIGALDIEAVERCPFSNSTDLFVSY